MNRTPADNVYHFSVVCPNADEVYLLGAFNRWSTTATPMSRAGGNVWQLSLELPDELPERHNRTGRTEGRTGAANPFAAGRFGYFVIDKRWKTGSAPLGNTYLLPDARASVVRRPGNN
jgi:hypothetical protein